MRALRAPNVGVGAPLGREWHFFSLRTHQRRRSHSSWQRVAPWICSASSPRCRLSILATRWALTLLFREDNETDLTRFIEAQLGAVLADHEQHGLGLVEPLGAYLDSERSPTRAAAALHVQRKHCLLSS